jgi:hypothetical protein
MKKKICLLMVLFSALNFSNIYAWTLLRPMDLKEYPTTINKKFDWMRSCKRYKGITELVGVASEFISKSELDRYTRLKMRNFVNDIKFVEQGQDGYFSTTLEVYKYHDKAPVYYGLLQFEIDCGGNASVGKEYIYNMPFAYHEEYIKDYVKKYIDHFSELYAEDYYFVQDLELPSNKKIH